MKRLKQVVIFGLIMALVVSSLSYIPNELTPEWWEKATLEDVKRRFNPYKHFNRQDKDGHSLLMLSLIHGKNPEVPAYFLIRGDDIFYRDETGKTPYDYALSNPNMKEIAEVIYELQHVNIAEFDEKDLQEKIRPLKPSQKYALKREKLGLELEKQSRADELNKEDTVSRPPLNNFIIRKVLQKHQKDIY